MATFPGLSLLSNFAPIFTFLLSFSVIFGILELTAPFGKDKKGISSVVAFTLSILLLFSTSATNIISFMAPWFVIAVIVIFFTILLIMMLGVKAETITEVIKGGEQGKTVIYFIIFVVAAILVLSVSLQFGQNVGPYLTNETIAENNISVSYVDIGGGQTVAVSNTDTGSFQQNLGATIFHPKILGMAAILVIASFSIRFLAKTD